MPFAPPRVHVGFDVTSWDTPRLSIDALRPADAAAFFAYRAAPAVMRYQGWYPATLEAASTFIQEQSGRTLAQPGWTQRAIRLRESGELVGDLGVCMPDSPEDSATFGISLNPTCQGTGLATEAMRRLLGWLFEERDMRRVVASVDPRNTGSMKLLARLGMRQEAHFREAYLLRGEWVDDVVFAMLQREWAAVRDESR
ncbi:GNAT family protein [Dyella sp.]|uniref:GNAT family N-acetyltransferase n=1 Tax=Dyella sp. TaxID=1869338 RepID=UPI002ED0D34E